MKRFVSVNTPVFNGNEKKYLLDCIDSGWVSSDGPYVKRFEKIWLLLSDENLVLPFVMAQPH